MALDFPANPSDGEVFGSYVWSASKGVWQSREESAAPAVVSPVPPESASPGDIWVDSSDGISYVYYDDGSSGQWIEMISSGVVSLEAASPTGSVIQTARATAPTGWLLCEGQAVSRSEYSRLFNAIGTAYGNGNGSTTFNIPNLKGRVPVGRDSSQTEFDSLGETGGEKTVAISAAQMPTHSHTGSTGSSGSHAHTGTTGFGNAAFHRLVYRAGSGRANNHVTGYDGSGGFGDATDTNYPMQAHTHSFTTSTDGSHTHSFTTDNAGSGQAHQNLQPYVVLNYIIKV
jgi:microcystin-dependent protein